MNNSEKLIPVSFHLRNFNLYQTLDLPVSENGNVALVGENGVGKTTLANCFFPMLVDGSIATPSFNPTTDTGKLNNSVNPRNSSRDSRNFESMLLGWGRGAMKVRIGYVYEYLASKYREVILGIGAYRAVGDTRSQTWWFVAINEDPAFKLTIQTTDDKGHSLDKEAFKTANANLGSKLTVFEKAADYREFVAFQIFGFSSGQELGLLAQADRMIASPMLTAGNAKFEPIRQALVNSQEEIDTEIIQKAAELQRKVNDKQSLMHRIEVATDRINRIKQVNFLGNMNQLNKLIISPYSRAQNEVNQQKNEIETLLQKKALAQKSITTQTNVLADAEAALADLRAQKALEKTTKQRRAQLQKEIGSLHAAITKFKQAKQQQAALHAEQQANQEEAQSAAVTLNELNQVKVAPLKAEIKQTLEKLGWDDLDYQVGLDVAAQSLNQRLQAINDLVNRYQRWVSNSQNLSESVTVFTDTRDQMDDRIEVDVTGFHAAPTKEKLHDDNRTIHETGAGKISRKYDTLKNQISQLVADHPEVLTFNEDQHLVTTIRQYGTDLDKLGRQLTKLQQRVSTIEATRVSLAKQLAIISSNLDETFSPESAQKEIEQLQQELDHLKLDPMLDDKIAAKQREQKQLQAQIDRAKSQVTSAQTKVESYQQQISDEEAEMAGYSDRMDVALDQLKPYLPASETLVDIESVAQYCSENQTIIRNNQISEMSDKISRLINRSTAEMLDNFAVNVLFDERGYSEMAEKMFPHATENLEDVVTIRFNVDQALRILDEEHSGVVKALQQVSDGRDLANSTYEAAVIQRIAAQYHSVNDFNQMLSDGTAGGNGIKIKIELAPSSVDQAVIDEALDPTLTAHPAIDAEIKRRLDRLANDPDLADDDQLFSATAKHLLDTRTWSQFIVKIKRRQSDEDDYELVDDRFVTSGGSGAEKAQAMVLPLLLVPKMILNRSTKPDAPYLVMFDEFADKLDPDTARIFAKTINKFGFNFIATMPSGAQSKLLSDGVDNITYQVIAPTNRNDGKFHVNQVKQAYTWEV